VQSEPDGRGEQAAGLQPVQRREIGGVAGDVAVLAADHAERRLRELPCDGRGRVGEGEPERLREQRVAGEQGDAVAERDVRAGPAAALIVVVERGQVVVDEREGVHELEGRGRRQAALGVGPGGLADGEAEHRTDALAT
jgi:hypothetical protein